MTQLTLQDVFDTSVRGVYKQGRAAYSTQTSCVYRLVTDEGETLKCGIGHVIPDKLYDPIIEGLSIAELMFADDDDFPSEEQCSEAVEKIAEYFKGFSPRVIQELQLCHDATGTHGPGFMEEYLAKALAFSYQHDLTWPSDVPRPD